jgi:ribosomal protein S27E
MNRYSNDPRQITARFSSRCSKCKVKIQKDTIIYYWPSSREVYCLTCGEAPYRQFLSSVADEEAYSGNGNPYAW